MVKFDELQALQRALPFEEHVTTVLFCVLAISSNTGPESDVYMHMQWCQIAVGQVDVHLLGMQ